MQLPNRKFLRLAFLLLSTSQAYCAERVAGWDEVMAVGPYLPLKFIQSSGAWLTDKCVSLNPAREVEFRQAFADWRYSKYVVETKINGRLVDSSLAFKEMAEKRMGSSFNSSNCENFAAGLRRFEEVTKVPDDYLDQFSEPR